MASNKDLRNKYLKNIKELNADQNISDIYTDLLHGKTETMRYSRLESSVFDTSWIEVVEDVIFDLGEIVSNPRSVTKQESSIVPVELAKKTDGESVQHLASHSQYVKEIDEVGNVIPSKILSHSNEDNIHTYENRFIATFIRRLVLFIEKRYEFIVNRMPLHSEDVMYVKNSSIINGDEVEIETKIRVRKKSDDPVSLETDHILERIVKMREYIFFYYNSSFMKKFKNDRDVRKPILQTNIIRKNPLYRHCYQTFLFIEKFNSLGVNYHVNEEFKSFNEDELADINYMMLSSYFTIGSDKDFDTVKRSQKTYKPKILTSIDDEIFTFGEPLTGTLEFVRVDEPYREFLNRRRHVKDLPLHPRKWERLYYKDEYTLKRMYEEDFDELEKLLRRKVRENENYEKIVQRILLLVAEEEREAARRRFEAIIADERRRIEEKRKELIAKAYAEYLEMEKEKAEKEEARRLKALKEAERKAKEEAEQAERDRLEAERKAKEQEEELARIEAEETKRKELEAAEEAKRVEEEARRKAEEEAEAIRLAEEEAKKAEEEAEALKLAEETKKVEEEARKQEIANSEEKVELPEINISSSNGIENIEDNSGTTPSDTPNENNVTNDENATGAVLVPSNDVESKEDASKESGEEVDPFEGATVYYVVDDVSYDDAVEMSKEEEEDK